MKSKEQKILDQMVLDYEKYVAKLEDELAAYALEHNLHLSLGDYGNGRTLLLEDHEWSGKDRGDWLYSSEIC